MSREVVDSLWFTGTNGDLVGIVVAKNSFGHKAFIGYAGKASTPTADAYYIIDHGSRFHQASKLWPHITDWEP